MSEAKERSNIIVGNFEVSLPTKDGRTIKMSGYVFADDEEKDINDRMDMCQAAIERQALRTEVQLLENHRRGAMEAIEQQVGFMADMASLKRSGKSLSTVQKEKLTKIEGGFEALKRSIVSYDEAIADGKKQLNGAHAP